MVKKVIHIADKDLPIYLIQTRNKYVNGVTFNNHNLPDLLYTTKHTIDG